MAVPAEPSQSLSGEGEGSCRQPSPSREVFCVRPNVFTTQISRHSIRREDRDCGWHTPTCPVDPPPSPTPRPSWRGQQRRRCNCSSSTRLCRSTGTSLPCARAQFPSSLSRPRAQRWRRAGRRQKLLLRRRRSRVATPRLFQAAPIPPIHLHLSPHRRPPRAIY